jgi:general L-amino acid transport system substrate-binding protein
MGQRSLEFSMSISIRPSMLLAMLALSVSAGIVAEPAEAQTLAAVKSRGALVCGVGPGVVGFSAPSPSGQWSGFDVDFCRALAAAIFDDADKVKFVPLSAADRFRALQAGEIDVLSRNSTWTLGREVEFGVTFAAVTFYDGQGFMVRRARRIETALDLDGSKVCAQSGTTTALNLADYFSANGMKYEPVLTASAEETVKAYDGGQCDTMTTDASALHSERLKLARPDDHVILPDVISKEPLGPVVRQGDTQWSNIVKWTHYAMLDAEELGVSSQTLDAALASLKPDVRRLVGSEGGYGERMGLTNDWVVRIVRRVGNYAEVYERNVGVKTRLGIPRGINHLWTAGGIQYAPPIR